MDGAVVYECYAVNKQALSDSRLSLITYGLYIEVPGAGEFDLIFGRRCARHSKLLQSRLLVDLAIVRRRQSSKRVETLKNFFDYRQRHARFLPKRYTQTVYR